MLGKVWKWLAIAASAAVGILYFLWRIAEKGREVSEAKAARETAKRKSVESTQETERDIAESVNRERERAEEIERENQERRESGTRPDEYGDPRLRDKD